MERGVSGRHVLSGEKRGDHVGPTKRGKGTKLVLVADGQGLPVACRIASARPAEVTLARGTLDKVRRPKAKRVIPVVADRAYDSDTLRHQLRSSGWDLVCPHRRGRVRRPTQDGRKLRRYRRRWKIERTFSWLGSYRRLLVRHEFYSFVFAAFIKLACLLILVKRF